MKTRKFISGLLACALVITQFSGTMTFASVDSASLETPPAISAPADNTTETPNLTEPAPAEETGEKGADAVKAVVDLFTAVPDGVTAVAEGEDGYDAYKAAIDTAVSAMNALNALGAEDKAAAETAIGDKFAYVSSLIPVVAAVNAEEGEAGEGVEVDVPTTYANPTTATTGEAVRDYELLGGVTVRFEGTVGEYSIVLEANDVARTYGEGYVPNGFTMTVKGLTADEQTAFDYKAVFDNPTTPETGDLIPVTFNVVGGTEQNGKTAAGTYSVGVSCGANAVTYAGHSFAVSTTNKGNITVSRRPITIVAQDAYKTYGQSDPTFNYTVKSGMLVNGDVLYVNGAGQGLYREHNGDATEQVGSYAIKSNLINSNYNITFEDAGRLEIAKAALVITGGFTDALGTFKQTHTREYGDKDLPFGFTAKGLQRGDNLADFGTITVDFKATSTSVPGDYYVTPSGLGDTLPNYDVTYTNGTLHVDPRTIEITVDDASKEYGDEDPELTYEILAPNAATPKKPATAWDGKALVSLKGDVTRVPGENAGSYGIINGYTAEKNPNYKISFKANDFVIKQAPLTITAESFKRFYGEENPEFTVVYEGFKNGETPADNSLTGKLVIDCAASKTSDVGTYGINASGFDTNGNYKIKYNAGVLTVEARPITVNISDLESMYGEPIKELSYEFVCTLGDAIVNGDTITGGVTTDPTPVKDAGKYKIISTFAHKNYVFTVNEGTYTVTARPLTVTIDNQTSVYGDKLKELTYSIGDGSLVAGDEFTGKVGFKPGVEVKNVGRYDIVCNFETPMKNYDVTVVKGVYEITPATIKVTMADTSKLYGTKTVVPELKYEGFKYDDEQFVNVMAVALMTRNASILPNVTIEIADEVAGIKGYVADDANATAVYTDVFKFTGETFGNYKYEMASGNLSVSRLQSTDTMYSVNGSKKDENTYNSNVSVKAAEGYKLSYSDALEGNTWADSLQINGDATHNVKFYVVRLSDGAITSSSAKTIKIDTYVAPAENPGPIYTVVSNPRTGADFIMQNIWLIIALAFLVATVIVYFVMKKKNAAKTLSKADGEVIDVEIAEVSDTSETVDKNEGSETKDQK